MSSTAGVLPENAPTRAETERARWPKYDAFAFISGGATYLDDIEPAGTLHMAVVRSPVAHGKLLGVDVGRALAMDGVVAALDGREAARHLAPMPYVQNPEDIDARTFSVPALAVDELRWLGEPVAVVVAESAPLAQAAAAAVRVRHEELRPVLDLDELGVDPFDDEERFADLVLAANDFTRGDTGSAFASAPHSLRSTVRIARSSTAPMEPRGYLASWDSDGRLTVHASHQQPFQLRWELSQVLRMPEDSIRVVVPQVGGSFGLKMTGFGEEPLVCLLSKLTGRPVKFVESRAECFLGGGREQIHRAAVAFDDQGRLLALRDHITIPVGAASTSPGWRMAYVTAATFPSAYDIPAVEIRSRVLLTNQPPWHSCRGYGKDTAIVVIERLLDMVAAHLGLDPADVRRRNLLPSDRLPHRLPSGYLIDSGDFGALLDRALTLADYRPVKGTRAADPEDDVVEGVGIAFEITPEGGGHPSGPLRTAPRPTAPAPETATVSVNTDGRVEVRSGVTNPGGGNDTSLAQLAADELGTTRAMVTVVQGDTDRVPPGTGHASSRATAVGGAAVVLAARDVASRLRARAAERTGARPDEITLVGGRVEVGRRPVMTLADLCSDLHSTAGAADLTATRSYVPQTQPGLNDNEEYRYTYPYVSSGVYVARVLVDLATGKTTITGLVAVHDCGRVINPTLVEGQMHGAMATGAGLALFEESLSDTDGSPLTSTFKHYLLPRANDLPSMVVEHIETPSPHTLLGAKGAGEAGVGGTMAAVLNAVANALGPGCPPPTALPLTPPRVLDLLARAHGSVKP
ncbi:xanthine dehydrogenase family protein molybdopterin-binding subunit [Streptomyces sp. R02]|uniref:Xanthine dehydrogenase family protein molybdopterin-binding subunit n=1 Tax=Streptomyces sp. R02 TaxID=3238623 RepID=A0AB39M0D7_9ACTN|nr:xanthine dehydrogenase family protein molybdopterin-binding subunit [Streptomyces pseudogriseolus]